MIYRFDTEEGSRAILRLQVIKENGNLITQSDISAIKLFVYEVETATQKSGSGGDTLVVADTIYNTAQTWTVDDIGFNFRVVIPASYISNGGKTYRVELKLTDSTSNDFYLAPVELLSQEMFSN